MGGFMKFKFLALTLLLSVLSLNVVPSHAVKEHQIDFIYSLITKVKNNISEERAQYIAEHIYESATHYQIDPKVIIAIIDTESNFRKGMISHTGDLSLVQINPQVWNREFARLRMTLIDPELLQADEAYAINLMCEILSIIKNRHSETDARWFARYHSRTKKFKDLYHQKVDSKMRLMASV